MQYRIGTAVFWIRTSIPRFFEETTEMFFAVRIPARILFFQLGFYL